MLHAMHYNMNLLANATPRDINKFPFPHLVIENALPLDLYQELESTHPLSSNSLNQKNILKGDDIINKYIVDDRLHTTRFYPRIGVKENLLSQVWIDFINFHTSDFFFRYVVNHLFGRDIHTTYPGLLEYVDNNKVTLRKVIPSEQIERVSRNKNLVTHSVFVNNRPRNYQGFTSRTPHIDDPRQIYSILFYMRSKMDQSSGGGLEIYSKNNMSECLKYDLSKGSGRSIVNGLGERYSLIPYKANTVVAFINTPESIHGVEPIFNQALDRRSFVLTGEILHKQLFSLSD